MVTLAALGLVGVMPGGIASAGTTHGTEHPAAPAEKAHGIVELIGEALGEVSLRADQVERIELLGAKIEPLQIRLDEAEDHILLGLAGQVAVGRIDREALEPYVLGYVTARHELSLSLRTGLEELHALLDAEQRADFADALETRVHDVRRSILSAEALDDLSLALGLTGQQKEQIQEKLSTFAPAFEAEREMIHRVVEAFRGDTFAIEAVAPQADVPEKARERALRIIDVTQAVTDLLTPEQRVKFAERIREAALGRTSRTTEEHPAQAQPMGEDDDEEVGTAEELWWGAARGPRGGVVVAGGPRFAYRRVRAFPVAVGWGFGW